MLILIEKGRATGVVIDNGDILRADASEDAHYPDKSTVEILTFGPWEWFQK